MKLLRTVLVSSRPLSWVNTAYPFALASIATVIGARWTVRFAILQYVVAGVALLLGPCRWLWCHPWRCCMSSRLRRGGTSATHSQPTHIVVGSGSSP